MEDRHVKPRNDGCYDAAHDVIVHLFEIRDLQTRASRSRRFDVFVGADPYERFDDLDEAIVYAHGLGRKVSRPVWFQGEGSPERLFA